MDSSISEDVKPTLDANTLSSCIESIKNDDSISESSKVEIIKLLVNLKKKPKVQCDKCENWVSNLKTCEYCVVNFLKKNFSNWTSGDNDYNELIRAHQTEPVRTGVVIE